MTEETITIFTLMGWLFATSFLMFIWVETNTGNLIVALLWFIFWIAYIALFTWWMIYGWNFHPGAVR